MKMMKESTGHESIYEYNDLGIQAVLYGGFSSFYCNSRCLNSHLDLRNVCFNTNVNAAVNTSEKY